MAIYLQSRNRGRNFAVNRPEGNGSPPAEIRQASGFVTDSVESAGELNLLEEPRLALPSNQGMKGPLDRTMVVLRHLPPSITQEMLVDQVDTVFGGRYNWVSFRPGKASQKLQTHSRAYINFIRPEDVIEFAEFFNGHVFVNEKGELSVTVQCAQYKTIVEYAPSQHVPKQWSKRDGREGTISKDPEYMDFLEFLVKPVENLPNAEVQRERREAERPAAAKETPIVTPLMDFVRQKRASKGTTRSFWCNLERSSSNGKLSRRAGWGHKYIQRKF